VQRTTSTDYVEEVSSLDSEKRDEEIDEHLVMSAKTNKLFDILFGLGTFGAGMFKLITTPEQIYPAVILILGGYMIFNGESVLTILKIMRGRR